jgi:hypothetical protein
VFEDLASVFSCSNVQGRDFGGVQLNAGVGARAAGQASVGVVAGRHVASLFVSGAGGLGAGAGSSVQGFYWRGSYDSFKGPYYNATVTGADYSYSSFGNDQGGGVAFGPAIGGGVAVTHGATKPLIEICW